MVQERLNFNNFLGGGYIDTNICDDLIKYFQYNKKYANRGTQRSSTGAGAVKKDEKDSLDLSIGSTNFDTVIGEYREELQKILNIYLDEYQFANKVSSFDIVENFNLQKYEIKCGFKKWHCENDGGFNKDRARHLVFMTYLNNVEDGGTEFLYQKIKTKAEKGLTLIWPSAWTHTHRGIISTKKEKYIVTGWYSFRENNND